MLQEPHAAVGEDTTPDISGVVRSLWHVATIAEGRESCTAPGAAVGDNKQWRLSAFGADGKYTRLQGQSAFGDDGRDTRLQGHQGQASVCQSSAHRGTEVGCRKRSRRVPRDRRGALAPSQQPTWRALDALPLQLHQATGGDQAGFSMVFAAPSIYGRPVAPWLRHLCSDGCVATVFG